MEYLFNKIPPHLIKKICQRCENASDILSLETAYPDLNSVLRMVFWNQIRTLTILDDEHHGSSMWINTRDDLSYGVEWTTDMITDILTRSCELRNFHLLCDSARNETMSAFIVDVLLSTEGLQLTSILLGLPSTSKFAFRTESHGEWPSRSLLKCLVKLVDQQKSTLRHFLILSAQSHLMRLIRGENSKLNTEFVGYCDPLIYSVFHYPLIRAFSDVENGPDCLKINLFYTKKEQKSTVLQQAYQSALPHHSHRSKLQRLEVCIRGYTVEDCAEVVEVIRSISQYLPTMQQLISFEWIFHTFKIDISDFLSSIGNESIVDFTCISSMIDNSTMRLSYLLPKVKRSSAYKGSEQPLIAKIPLQNVENISKSIVSNESLPIALVAKHK